MKGIKRLYLSSKEISALNEEIKAQINKFISYGCRLNHIDSHRHAHTNYPVLSSIIEIIKHTEIDCQIRLSRNIPNEAMKGNKGLYKRFINQKIKKFNQQHFSIPIDYFGSISDYDKFKLENRIIPNCKIEIMVHPIIVNGQLSDAINNYSIEEWMKSQCLS